MPLLDPPMIKCSGPVGVPRTFRYNELEVGEVRLHPVVVVEPTVYVPPVFTVSSVPVFAPRSAPVVVPELSVKLRSLMSWVTSLGFDKRLFRVTLTDPAPVVKIACALT